MEDRSTSRRSLAACVGPMPDDPTRRADASHAFKFEVGGLSTSGSWTEANQAFAVAAIAHGAGAGLNHPFMAGVAEGLAAGGVSALRFNFPYIDARRRAPDSLAVLIKTWEVVMRQAADYGHGLPIVAGGKSMGGRMASMLAAKQGTKFAGAALVFFGYPLHAPGRTDDLRDAHLSGIRVPMLFIQGSRDSLARLDLMQALVKRLALARLHVVTGGDHSFRVAGVKRSDQESGRALAEIAIEFIREIMTSHNPQ